MRRVLKLNYYCRGRGASEKAKKTLVRGRPKGGAGQARRHARADWVTCSMRPDGGAPPPPLTGAGRPLTEESRASARPLVHVGARTKGRRTTRGKDTAKARNPANPANKANKVGAGAARSQSVFYKAARRPSTHREPQPIQEQLGGRWYAAGHERSVVVLLACRPRHSSGTAGRVVSLPLVRVQ